MDHPDNVYRRLLRFYDQRGVSGAPWPVLNKLSDEELEQHLELNRWLESVSEPNTRQHAHARVFAGWVAQAMIIRSFRRDFAGLAA